MNMGFAFRLALPRECSVGKMNLQTKSPEKLIPQDGDLFALADGIGRNKTNLDLFTLNIFPRPKIPCRDVVEHAVAFNITANQVHVGLLPSRLLFLPHERRISE